MSRINTNISSITAQRILTKQNAQLNLSLERLSTGLRINSGKDDPSGLIASETMRAEMSAIQAAQTNVSRAINVISVAESGLSEINTLLNDLEDLVDRSANEAGISDEERDANQQEIDLILNSINRIANSTELQGRKLLAGDLAYTTSGVSADNIAHLQLNTARVPDGGSRTVAVDITSAASQATLSFTGGSITADPVTIEISGKLGTERLTFASTASADIITAINQSSDLTGIEASQAGVGIVIRSVNYGSDEYVKVKILDDTATQWTMVGGGSSPEFYDEGEDAVATVNGQSVTADGLKLNVRTSTLDATITLATAFGASAAGGTSRFGITGGGADFAIAPKLDLNGLASIGIDSVSTSSLGDGNTGYLYQIGSGEDYDMATGDFNSAQNIVRNALSQIATLRGRLGSFQKNTLETNANSLAIQYENVASAESILRDTDFAEETSSLTRAQILVQSATNVLQLANAQPQNVLALIG